MSGSEEEQIKSVDAKAEAAANAEQYAETATGVAVGLSIGLSAIKDIASIVPGVGIAFAAASQLAVIYAKNAKLYALLMDIKEILAQNFLMSRMIEESMKILSSEIQQYNKTNTNIQEIKIPTYVVERITTKINKLNVYLTRYIPKIKEGRDMSKFNLKISESFSKIKSGLSGMFSRSKQQYGGGVVSTISNSVNSMNNFMSAGTIFENIHNHLNVMNAFFIIMNQRFETIRAHYANHTDGAFKNHFNSVIWPKILDSTQYKNYIKEQTTEEIFNTMNVFNETNKQVIDGTSKAATVIQINATDKQPEGIQQYGGRTRRRRRRSKRQSRKYKR